MAAFTAGSICDDLIALKGGNPVIENNGLSAKLILSTEAVIVDP